MSENKLVAMSKRATRSLTRFSHREGRKATKADFVCPICLEDILEDEDRRDYNSIHCDGHCSTWLHGGCAGLTREAVAMLSRSSDPFYCPQCRLDQHEKEIIALKDILSHLSRDMEYLKSLQPSGKSTDTYRNRTRSLGRKEARHLISTGAGLNSRPLSGEWTSKDIATSSTLL